MALVDPSNAGIATGRAIGFATISSYKGLECDAVVLVDLQDLKSTMSSMQMYIGASRARVHLTVLLPEAEREEFGQLAYEFGRHSIESSNGCE